MPLERVKLPPPISMWQVSTGQTKGLSQGQLNGLSICPHIHDKSLAYPGKAGGNVQVVDRQEEPS